MEPVGTALPGALEALLRDVPLSDGKVAVAWKAAVGPALERVTAVKLENGVLLVEAASEHWAREVARSAAVILPRLQKLLGAGTVGSIRLRPVAWQPRRAR